MKRSGKVVWINPSAEVLADRLRTEREQRPLLQNIANEELLTYIQKKIADRRLYYEQADVRIDKENIDLAALLKSIAHV
jgi:shikimate kinase